MARDTPDGPRTHVTQRALWIAEHHTDGSLTYRTWYPTEAEVGRIVDHLDRAPAAHLMAGPDAVAALAAETDILPPGWVVAR